METKTDLREGTVEAIQELIATNFDSAKQLESCSEDTEDERFEQLFQHVADARRPHATERRGYVR